MNSILIAETIGTMLLILLGNGVVANVVLKQTKGNASGWIVITTGWAFAVFTGVVVAGPYSGAHLNPAVTIGLAVADKVQWNEVPSYLAGEMIGAIIGAILVWVVYKDHFDATENEADKLACFSTGPAIRNLPLNFVSEIIGTFVLVFAIFYLAGPSFESAGITDAKVGLGSIGALPVSIIVWVIGLSLGGSTGYAINPARDLAPRIAHAILPFKGSSDWGYSWVPVIGPLVGAVIAALLFAVL
ncbi:MAG: aquaporin [Bacteroidia bacterium]|nr:MAG: aquaporin [Bacteroidia bacterium]